MQKERRESRRDLMAAARFMRVRRGRPTRDSARDVLRAAKRYQTAWLKRGGN